MKKVVLFLVTAITLIFSSCMKEDNVMFNTGDSVRANVTIPYSNATYYESGSNVEIYYEIENYSYWTIDYYEILFVVYYQDSSMEHNEYILHEVANGAGIPGHATGHGQVFVDIPGDYRGVYVEDYKVYN